MRSPLHDLFLLAGALTLACNKGPVDVPPPVTDEPLEIGKEYPPHGEAKDIAEVRQILVDFVKQRYTNNLPARRDAHVKSHGCVQAEVTVADDLPAEYRIGLFSEPGTYEAWIRFSSSADHIQRDGKPDGRGMAIKVMNAPGGISQDFILINYPVFVVQDARNYVEFTKDSTTGHPLRFFTGKNRREDPNRKYELRNAERLALARVKSPLAARYWSMTPYALGEGAAKYSAVPCGANERPPLACGKNFLQDSMARQLRDGEACFHFDVQRQVDANRQPIEDPTVNWSESLSPFATVATIRIPSQSFSSGRQQAVCENLSFNPWHSLPEHRPLGGINRVRKAVYGTISALRHSLNHVREFEPKSFEDTWAQAELGGVFERD